jgi:hypothetical protein
MISASLDLSLASFDLTFASSLHLSISLSFSPSQISFELYVFFRLLSDLVVIQFKQFSMQINELDIHIIYLSIVNLIFKLVNLLFKLIHVLLKLIYVTFELVNMLLLLIFKLINLIFKLVHLADFSNNKFY